ncbi:MAG: hypothetical protein QM702_25535 [Rubrivivax sp.]
MNTAARLVGAALLPLCLSCQAGDTRGPLDLRMPRAERTMPRLFIVPEPAFATPPAHATLSRPVLAFEDGEGPVAIPRGALRVQLSGDASLSLRPRRNGLAVAWRKRF